ncbi:MAG: ABC transporter permease [Chlorobiaceae bacterium]|nr:ABC transporter permease [Chlorobiaceae bacterium]
MKPELYIAMRFAFKQRSTTKPTFIVMVAVVGIAVGTAALILTLSIVNGFAGSVQNKLISFSAHMQFRYPEEQLCQERRSDLAHVASHRNVSSVTPFLEKSFVLRNRTNVQGETWRSKPVIVKGVNEAEQQVFLKKFLKEGSFSPVGEKQKNEGIALYAGQTLAENLGLAVGKKVMLVGLGSNSSGAKLVAGNKSIVDLLSSLDLEVGIIRGIYDTGLQEGFDDYIVISDLKQLQQRFNPMMISGYDANVKKLDQLPNTVKEVTASLGYPFYGYTVFQRYANLFEWLKLQKNITPLLIVTITIVAVFNIISTLLVLIIEKTREIGMLSALGLEPGKISQVFMAQAVLISLSGIAAGNILAISLSLFELRFHLITLPEKSYFIKYVPLLIDPSDYALVSLAVMALTLFFAFIPARIAASLKPGTALNT